MCSSEKDEEKKFQFFKSMNELKELYSTLKEDYYPPEILEVKRKVLLKKDANISSNKEILVVEKVEYEFNSIEDAFHADNTKMTDDDLEKISDGDIVTLYFSVCFFKWQIQGRLQTGFRNELTAIKLIEKSKLANPEVSPVKFGSKKRKLFID